MSRKQFPHKNRKLTAAYLIILFTVFTILNLAQNYLFKTDEEKKLRLALLQNPKDSALHEKLGQYYLETAEKAAEKEYLIAEEYYSQVKRSENTKVLGSKSRPWQTWQNLVGKKQNLVNEIGYWEKVRESYPDYLYSYLKLAQLNWKKGDTKKAQSYLEMVLREDPTNQEAKRLLEVLK